MVDKKKNKLLFAEADGSFVDTLFSFLTLPLGTIVGKVISVGCFSNLYESVKNLDKQCFCTETCKDMLLNPKSSLGKLCRELKINIDIDTEPIEYFSCDPTSSLTKCSRLLSICKNTVCSTCGRYRVASLQTSNSIPGSRKHEVFVTNTSKFIITDDLQVMPPGKVIELLNTHSIQDMNLIEEKIVRLGANQFLELLKWMFLSTTPLTDLFVLKRKFPDRFTPEDLQRPLKKNSHSFNQAEKVVNMKVKVMLRKSNKKVLFVESQQEFIDFLFCFLTIPLGQMLRILDGHSSVQSIDGLYKSALALDSQHFISENQKNILLRPKVAPFFNCKNQLFPVEADDVCLFANGVWNNLINPKLPIGDKRIGTGELGDFVRGSTVFMVTDNLDVTPYSPGYAISILNINKISPSDLEERTVSLGIAEGLSILRASFNSTAALTNGLSHILNSKLPKQEIH